jgi:acyl-CoA thioester hydrolase
MHGFLSRANYLRWMEETAFAATAALGFDRARYEAMGRLWLAHETTLTIHTPLRYGETAAITTYIADFRGVRSFRRYEFRRDGELIARGQTDWVYIDMATGRPATIGPEVIEAFGGPEAVERLERPPFPMAPRPDDPFTLDVRVSWRDIDTAGHVNNAVYIDYIEEAARQAETPPAGRVYCIRDLRIAYRQAAVWGDALRVRTWAFDRRRVSGLRHFDIMRGDSAIARARVRWLWADPVSGRVGR